MIELKEHWEYENGPIVMRRKVYYKSEADTVIAELKDKALQYKVLYKELCKDINTQERFFAIEVAHQKYKRCLAMAKLCGLMSAFHGGEWYARWINRWYERWQELADKFKETKSAPKEGE